MCAAGTDSKMRVGFVGVGIMGLAMVRPVANRKYDSVDHMELFRTVKFSRYSHAHPRLLNQASIMLANVCLKQAKNLIKGGYDVTVWNRNKAKCQPLQELGAKVDIPSVASSTMLACASLAVSIWLQTDTTLEAAFRLLRPA